MKTVNVVPTWMAGLQIVTMLFQESRTHIRGAKNQKLMDERIALMCEVFGPLCEQADKAIAKARGTTVVESLPCGHQSLNADMLCSTCGADPVA